MQPMQILTSVLGVNGKAFFGGSRGGRMDGGLQGCHLQENGRMIASSSQLSN